MPMNLATVAASKSLGGLRHLDRFAGGPRSAMQEFLALRAFRDVQFHLWDFQNDTLNLDDWTTNAGTGATAFAIPGTLGHLGTVEGATGTNGTAGNRVVNLYGPPIYKGDAKCGAMIRFKVSAITEIEWGFGFIDTHDTITTAVVLVGDIDDASSLAAGMGDAALIYQDTAQTLTTTSLICLGSSALNAGSFNPIGTFAPTADTYVTAMVQLDTNTATASLANGDGPVSTASKASGIEGGTLVRPFFVISGVSATSRTYTIDYIATWQSRV
jgi:hypothetical protein